MAFVQSGYVVTASLSHALSVVFTPMSGGGEEAVFRRAAVETVADAVAYGRSPQKMRLIQAPHARGMAKGQSRQEQARR